LEGYTGSIFRVEEYTKQETNEKKVARREIFYYQTHVLPQVA
jgi:hypothetical protein